MDETINLRFSPILWFYFCTTHWNDLGLKSVKKERFENNFIKIPWILYYFSDRCLSTIFQTSNVSFVNILLLFLEMSLLWLGETLVGIFSKVLPWVHKPRNQYFWQLPRRNRKVGSQTSKTPHVTSLHVPHHCVGVQFKNCWPCYPVSSPIVLFHALQSW